MNYPYLQLLPLLRSYCSPLEYVQRVEPYRRARELSSDFLERSDLFWSIIPTYLYARCPFCETCCKAQINTYSLDFWYCTLSLDVPIYDIWIYAKKKICDHVMGTHRFINLHEHVPAERDYFSNDTGEIPIMTPWLFPADIPVYAVLSAYPVCKVMPDHFAPSYTLFLLTYFSTAPTLVKQRHIQREMELYGHDREFRPSLVQGPDRGPKGMFRRNDQDLYDLAAWAGKGQLGWLDPYDPMLPLRLGVGEQLPPIYAQVTGDWRSYTFRHGIKRRY